MRYERQLILAEWGSRGQSAVEAATVQLPCAEPARAVAVRYLEAAGFGAVGDAPCTHAREFERAVTALPWHASSARAVGLGAACAVDALVHTLREARR